MYLFALVMKEDFFVFLNHIKNNELQQKFKRWSTLSHVYSDWWGDVADWATIGMFYWNNQTQMQKLHQIFLKRSYAQAAPVWILNQKGEMPPLH